MTERKANQPAGSIPDREADRKPPAIGGYFELELNPGEEYHRGACRLNCGRNALEVLIRARGYQKAILPYYTCETVLQAVERSGAERQFYHINRNFEPLFDFSSIREQDCFLYTNYYGLKDDTVRRLSGFCRNLIVDNAQAFFSKPIPGVDTFYSPRKFFGLPDGAYLYTDAALPEPIPQGHSDRRIRHLLVRAEHGPKAGYPIFLEDEESLSKAPIESMSNLTRRLLENIDYPRVRRVRRENYSRLHESLGAINLIRLELSEDQAPMTYPFYSPIPRLRQKLIKRSIYVAQYWANVLEWAKAGDLEYDLALNLVPLPVDQRYSSVEMDRIIRSIFIELGGGYAKEP